MLGFGEHATDFRVIKALAETFCFRCLLTMLQMKSFFALCCVRLSWSPCRRSGRGWGHTGYAELATERCRCHPACCPCCCRHRFQDVCKAAGERGLRAGQEDARGHVPVHDLRAEGLPRLKHLTKAKRCGRAACNTCDMTRLVCCRIVSSDGVGRDGSARS